MKGIQTTNVVGWYKDGLARLAKQVCARSHIRPNDQTCSLDGKRTLKGEHAFKNVRIRAVLSALIVVFLISGLITIAAPPAFAADDWAEGLAEGWAEEWAEGWAGEALAMNRPRVFASEDWAGEALAMNRPRVFASDDETAQKRITEETCTMTVSRILSPEQYSRGEAALNAFFEKSLAYDENGFSGTLELEGFAYEFSYRTAERQVERVERYEGLLAPDIILIPTSHEFEVTSDVAPGAVTTAILEMAAVSWTLEDVDTDGRPRGHTAEVTYRGVERLLVLESVEVTATYSGFVIREEVPFLSWLPPFVPPITLPPLLSELVQQGGKHPLLAAATAATAVALLGVLALALLFRYWNVRLIAMREDGSTRTILRKHVRLVDGSAVLKIPEHCKLSSPTDTHLLRIKQQLVSAGGSLNIVWRGCLLFQLPIEREIDLQHRFFELLATTPIPDLFDEPAEQPA
ncbi:MAG: hypothetical protein FWD43_04090 [Coriobacteriia bacterium]|nr:hypothetical protein [Coriobacteriia bacterium]